MRRQKKRVDGHIARANIDRGVIVLLTGNGKGKTSSAFGMLARALGHGQHCAVAQFIKGQWPGGETAFFQQHSTVEFALMRTGFTWDTQNFKVDKEAAEAVWQQASKWLRNAHFDLLIYDEITYMFKFHYLDEQAFIQALKQRPSQQSVIITGRGASKQLRMIADTVSQISAPKHAFDQCVKARAGIEY